MTIAPAISEDDEDPVFFGVRSIGEIGSRVEHWVDSAVVRGTDDGSDIRAWGFDVGIVYETDLPAEPELTLGGAFGREFTTHAVLQVRQTGLQGSYFYYGEFLAPELSYVGRHGWDRNQSVRKTFRRLPVFTTTGSTKPRMS